MVGLALKPEGHNLKITAAAQEKGLLTVPAACNVIRLLPALIATTQQLSKSVAILDEVFLNKFRNFSLFFQRPKRAPALPALLG